MKTEDINALLDDMNREGNSLFFNAIEAFSEPVRQFWTLTKEHRDYEHLLPLTIGLN